MPAYHPLIIILAAAVFITAAAQPPASSPAPLMLPAAPPMMLPVSPPSMVPAPAPGLDCMPYLLNMSDCLSYVQNGSTTSKPDQGCCPELQYLVDMQPICLCQLLGHPERVPIPVDINRALKLPKVCNVKTPPVSMCAAIGVPVAAPGPGAAATGTSVPAGAPAPSTENPSEVAASPSPGGTSEPAAGQTSAAAAPYFPIATPLLIMLPYIF